MVADIRDALALPEGANEVIPDDSIQQAINSAEVIVDEKADPDISFDLKRVAVIDIASHRSFAAKQEAVKEEKEALDLAVSFNVEQLSSDLEQRRDDAFELIGAGGSPATLHTLGDRRPYHQTNEPYRHNHHRRF